MDGTPGQTRRGHLWGFTGGIQVIFKASMNGKQVHAAEVLEGFKGTLMTDGAGAYDLGTKEPTLALRHLCACTCETSQGPGAASVPHGPTDRAPKSARTPEEQCRRGATPTGVIIARGDRELRPRAT